MDKKKFTQEELERIITISITFAQIEEGWMEYLTSSIRELDITEEVRTQLTAELEPLIRFHASRIADRIEGKARITAKYILQVHAKEASSG